MTLANEGLIVRLYHGSDMAIERPDIVHNTGFADLGVGFYLTDDEDAAKNRARRRARVSGSPAGIVSIYDLDTTRVPWAVWGAKHPALEPHELGKPFGLRFEKSLPGIVAWANYIKSCRQRDTSIEGLGEPAIVRAWVATEEVEMVCSGFVTADDLAAFIDPEELVVQYCLLDQSIIDGALTFVGTETVS